MTNKYCIAFLSLHDGELTQEIVEADSEVSACRKVLELDKFKDCDNIRDMDAIYDYVANSDSYINCLKLN